MLDQEFINKMKDRLQQERLEVVADIQEISQPEMSMDNPDVTDLAEDAVEDILQDSSLSVLKNLLTKIDGALARIEDGSYGVCLETGGDIPEILLEKEPWVEVLPPIMRQTL